MNILALSGGKDSTCLALACAERGEEFDCVYTPAGDEPEEMERHINTIVRLIGKTLHVRRAKLDLNGLIAFFQALPSFRMRWCTRMLKIEPCIAFLLEQLERPTLLVGLRADEEERQGMYGDYAEYRYPLREWGWGEAEVLGYLAKCGVTIPRRTNCHRCYDQRLHEWWLLWKEKPDIFAEAEAQEIIYGHTFRSDHRDSWPASLKGLRERFERGDTPKQIRFLPLLGEYEVKEDSRRCRVCSL